MRLLPDGGDRDGVRRGLISNSQPPCARRSRPGSVRLLRAARARGMSEANANLFASAFLAAMEGAFIGLQGAAFVGASCERFARDAGAGGFVAVELNACAISDVVCACRLAAGALPVYRYW